MFNNLGEEWMNAVRTLRETGNTKKVPKRSPRAEEYSN